MARPAARKRNSQGVPPLYVTPSPTVLGGTGEVSAWTLQDARYVSSWNSGLGHSTWEGRWNSPGQHVIYAAIDPSTAILEVAVHKGFKVLNTVPHHLHTFTLADPRVVHVVKPADVPNPNWLKPIPSPGATAPGASSAGLRPSRSGCTHISDGSVWRVARRPRGSPASDRSDRVVGADLLLGSRGRSEFPMRHRDADARGALRIGGRAAAARVRVPICVAPGSPGVRAKTRRSPLSPAVPGKRDAWPSTPRGARRHDRP